MSFSEKIGRIQQALREQQLDGWLLYDFRRSNDLACHFLEISSSTLLTRRLCYWIPQSGEPIKIVSSIEPYHLDHLPGKKLLYSSWQEFEEVVNLVVSGRHRIAMEYSPRNAIPYVSKVDGGTLDIVRSLGVDVISSADLLQLFKGILTPEQVESHFKAAEALDCIAAQTWAHIRSCLNKGYPLTEYDVQQWILAQMKSLEMVTEGDPICAVNAHSADPHYIPTQTKAQIIQQGDFILIDLWCKQSKEQSIYADITRVGVANKQPSEKQEKIFQIVRQAQQAATDLVEQRFAQNISVEGWEVDQIAREVITKAGYGKFFNHRTGHNIDTRDHGAGTHLDNLETHDNRRLLPGTCFSIEPGIYLPGEFGVRLEYDIYVHQNGKIQVTGGIQSALVTLT